MASVYSKLDRAKQYLTFFFGKYEPKCFFCGEKLTAESFYPYKSSKKRDELTIHHIDENRSNNKISNLALVHRSCHRQYHRLRQLGKLKKQLKPKRRER